MRRVPAVPSAHRGVGLVELMVGMALGLVLVLVAMGAYLQNAGSTRFAVQQAQMNEEAAIALDVLATQVRLAGFSTAGADGTRVFRELALLGCDGGFTPGSGTQAFGALRCNNDNTANDALAVRYEATRFNSQTTSPNHPTNANAPLNCSGTGITLEAVNGGSAYVPRRVMPRLIDNADPATGFAYLLDGPLSLHDVFSGGQWQQIVTGTGGRGERLVHALRIPINGTQARAMQASDVLWEIGPDTVNDANVAMGHLTHPLRSGQTAGGAWVLLTTTGHHNGHGDGSRHGLIVLDPTTGAVLRTITLPAGASAGRGMGGVTVVRNRDRRIVAAYAGDDNGQLWRFDLRGAPQDWRVSYNRPLFTTAGNRPIFGAPAWQPHPRGGAMVVLATGIALDENDLRANDPDNPTPNDNIHGIWDPTPIGGPDAPGFTPVLVSQLLVQARDGTPQTTSDGRVYSTSTRRAIDWSVHRGWTFALGHTHRGERALDQVRNLATSVLVNTTVVGASGSQAESCAASQPANYLYMLNALDGAGRPAFDIDGDGRLDPASMVYLPGGGFNAHIGVTFVNTDNSIARDLMSQLHAGLIGESPTTAPAARTLRAVISGTGNAPETIGLDPQGPRPWSRQQYQLSRTPQ